MRPEKLVLRSKQIQIFVLLPTGDLRRRRIVLSAEAGELGLLDMRIIVGEGVPETGAERLVSPERRACLAKRLRQRRRLHLVRRVRGLSGIESSCDAVEPG